VLEPGRAFYIWGGYANCANYPPAHVLAQGGWEHLCLPMRFERGRMPTTCLGWNDPRSEEGRKVVGRCRQRPRAGAGTDDLRINAY